MKKVEASKLCKWSGKAVVKILSVHAVKTQGKGEGEIKLHLFLTSDPDGDEWSAIRPGRFTS